MRNLVPWQSDAARCASVSLLVCVSLLAWEMMKCVILDAKIGNAEESQHDRCICVSVGVCVHVSAWVYGQGCKVGCKMVLTMQRNSAGTLCKDPSSVNQSSDCGQGRAKGYVRLSSLQDTRPRTYVYFYCAHEVEGACC